MQVEAGQVHVLVAMEPVGHVGAGLSTANVPRLPQALAAGLRFNAERVVEDALSLEYGSSLLPQLEVVEAGQTIAVGVRLG